MNFLKVETEIHNENGAFPDIVDVEVSISDVASALSDLRDIDQAEALAELHKYASPDLREAIRAVFK